MNIELKKQVLEALRISSEQFEDLIESGADDIMIFNNYESLCATIAAVEAEPDSAERDLTFEQIEACFPDGGDTNENGITVSAQWLHAFAHNVEDSLKGNKMTDEIELDLAFPQMHLHGDGTHIHYHGMTRRQYYAAKAMQSYALHAQYGVQQIVRYAFETADAMIKFEQDES